MPRGDKTGPEGQGPKTGRGLGPCNGENQKGSQFPKQLGRGRGRGLGRGLGRNA